MVQLFDLTQAMPDSCRVFIMMIFLLKITPPPTLRREVLQVLNNVHGPISVKPGCLACQIYQGVGEDQAILYLELWKSAAELHCHIQSAVYAKLLAAMDMSAVQPEINFYETSQVHGIELIESLRTQRGHSDEPRAGYFAKELDGGGHEK